MPSGKRLSENEKGQIEAFFKSGMSFRKIAKEMKRSDRVVRNFLQNKSEYGTKKNPGRPRKLSNQDERRVTRAASNSTRSLAEIRRQLDLNVSRETIRRTLHRSPHIVRAKMVKAPTLTSVHKEKRLEFARRNMSCNWNKV